MKIGIITYYHKSYNYGGNLQAYALCTALKNLGYDAKQISFDYREVLDKPFTSKPNFLRSIKHKITSLTRDKKMLAGLKLRKSSILKFNDKIPHSKTIYTPDNIKESLNEFDAFVTGSDQVWNPNSYIPEFFLDFVTQGQIKISYSASLGVQNLNNSQKKIFQKHLESFDAVSVREKEAVSLISDIYKNQVHWTLDPTLLLDKDEWDEIARKRLIDEKYVFCCFLGGDCKEREVAETYAKEKGLKLISLPFLTNHYRKCDVKFADEQLFDISPENFISLIKYSEFVFTDSFHASVFSLIYEKDFSVFNRSGCKGLETRIYSLLQLFQKLERFCDSAEKQNVQYINSLGKAEYTNNLENFENLKKSSLKFLNSSLVG